MPQNLKQSFPGLLPNYFKKIGIAFMIGSVVPFVLVKAMDLQLAQAQKEMVRILTMNAFILGLLFLAWARDKVEDEMTVVLRLKSLGFAFIWAVIYLIVKPLTNMLFREPIKDLSAQGLVLNMLFLFLIFYYLQKKGVFFTSKEKEGK